MITLVPLQKLLTFVAVLYAFISILMSIIFGITGFSSLLVAFKGAFMLEAAILAFVVFGWRKIWEKFPVLNKWIYPDLNGKWCVNIHWNRGNQNGTKYAQAFIKQDLFRLSIELKSDESESETLMVKPKKDPESSRPMLYYIYRNEPTKGASTKQKPHKGAAILKIDHTDLNILSGNYFTDRSTNGQFKLTRTQEIQNKK